MGHKHHHRRVALFASITTVLTCCVVGVALYDYLTPAQGVSAATSLPQINAVYLHDPARPGLPLDVVRPYGVQEVSVVADLTAKGTSVDAIFIDGSVLNTVSSQFLGQQLAWGAYVVGINVPLAALANIPGFQSAGDRPISALQHPSSLADPAKKPIFSFIYKQTFPGGGTQSVWGQEYIYSDSFVLRYIAQTVKNRGTGCPPRCGTAAARP